MKIRSDFVTNSSSSSFVIAYKNKLETDDKTLSQYPFLRAYPEIIERTLKPDTDFGFDGDEGLYVFHDIDEYNEYFLDRYAWNNSQTVEDIIGEDEYLRNRYNKTAEYINADYAIAVKRVDNWDDDTINFLRSIADKESFIIVSEDEY